MLKPVKSNRNDITLVAVCCCITCEREEEKLVITCVQLTILQNSQSYGTLAFLIHNPDVQVLFPSERVYLNAEAKTTANFEQE